MYKENQDIVSEVTEILLCKLSEKYCLKCRKYLPLNRFSADKYTPDHLQSWCRTCRKEYYFKNKPRIAALKKIRQKQKYDHPDLSRQGIFLNNGHPYLAHPGNRMVHDVIAERILGRPLKHNEVVHHIDNNGLNNSHDNLLICTKSYHRILHGRMKGDNHV